MAYGKVETVKPHFGKTSRRIATFQSPETGKEDRI